jgi:hypothetical protein
MVGQAWAPEVDACAIAASLHGFVTEVARHDTRGELRPAGALEAYEILSADWDHPGVPATASRAGQAIELFARGFGQARQL